MLKRLWGFGGRRSARFEMDMNPFRLCSGLKFLGYFMVVLVLGLIAVSYCAVVVLTLGPHLHGVFHSFLPFLLLALFHVLVLFSLMRNFFIFVLCISFPTISIGYWSIQFVGYGVLFSRWPWISCKPRFWDSTWIEIHLVLENGAFPLVFSILACKGYWGYESTHQGLNSLECCINSVAG